MKNQKKMSQVWRIMLLAIIGTTVACNSSDSFEEKQGVKLITINIDPVVSPTGRSNATNLPSLFYNESSLYVLASDENGNVLDYESLETSKPIELKVDTYNHLFFNLTFINKAETTPGGYNFKAYSFNYIPVGTELELHSATTYQKAFFKTINPVGIQNSGHTAVSTIGDVREFNTNTGNTSLLSYKPQSKLFITHYDDNNLPTGYKFANTIYDFANNPNEILTIDVSETNNPFSVEQYTPNQDWISSVNLYGTETANDYSNSYNVSFNYSDQTGNILVHYPENVFQSFSSLTFALPQTGNIVQYISYKKNAKYDFNLPANPFRINQINETEIEFSNFSVGSFSLFYFSDTEYPSNEWNVISPAGENQKVKLPTLPAEIIQAFAGWNNPKFASESASTAGWIEGITSIVDFIPYFGARIETQKEKNFKVVKYLFD